MKGIEVCLLMLKVLFSKRRKKRKEGGMQMMRGVSAIKITFGLHSHPEKVFFFKSNPTNYSFSSLSLSSFFTLQNSTVQPRWSLISEKSFFF
jgi:hypothetical protein